MDSFLASQCSAGFHGLINIWKQVFIVMVDESNIYIKLRLEAMEISSLASICDGGYNSSGESVCFLSIGYAIRVSVKNDPSRRVIFDAYPVCPCIAAAEEENVPIIHLPDRIQASAELQFTVETNVNNVYYRLYSVQNDTEKQIGSESTYSYNAALTSFKYDWGYNIQPCEYRIASYVSMHTQSL